MLPPAAQLKSTVIALQLRWHGAYAVGTTPAGLWFAIPVEAPGALLRLIREAEPEFSVRKPADGTMWIAVGLPVPPQHRIYAGFSLRDIARSILGVRDL
jgi:hypothetical protein